MKSMRRVSSATGLGADCSRVATCQRGGQWATSTVSLPTTHQATHGEVHPSHLLVVGPDQAEHKAAVHQGQQVAEEEGQADVEALGLLHVLGTQGRSATLTHPARCIPTQGLALTKATSDSGSHITVPESPSQSRGSS